MSDTSIGIQNLDALDSVINNIGIQTSYGTWASDNIEQNNKDIILEFILLVSLNYSNKQSEYDFLMNSDLERINFKKNLIKQISNNDNLKNNIIDLLIEFLKNKGLILENRNFDISFNMIEEGINVKCKINTNDDLKKNKLHLYSPTLFAYLKIDFLEDLKIKFYESRQIIKTFENPSYIQDLNNNTDIILVYLINKRYNINIKENFNNKAIFIEQEILQKLIKLNVNRPISIKYNQNVQNNNLSQLEIKFKIENSADQNDSDKIYAMKEIVNKTYKNLYKSKIKTVNKHFTFYDLLNFSPFDSDYMNYFINNLCIKNNNEISKNCYNNVKFDTNPYCSVITEAEPNMNEKYIINILYKDNANTDCTTAQIDKCSLSPKAILDIKIFIISKLQRQKCTYSDIIYYKNNFNKTTLEHMFKLIIHGESKTPDFENLFSQRFIEQSKIDTNKILTYPKVITNTTPKIYRINIESEEYKPCKVEKTPEEKNKEIITPNDKINYITRLFKDDFKLNISPNSELFDHINTYVYSSISKDEFFSTLKKLDYISRDKYILYRIKGLIKKFLKTVIQPEKKILNKDMILSSFNNMVFNPITEELLLAHLLYYLNSYNNTNEYNLNFIIN